MLHCVLRNNILRKRNPWTYSLTYGIVEKQHISGTWHFWWIRCWFATLWADCFNHQWNITFPPGLHESNCVLICMGVFVIVTQGRCSPAPPPRPPALLRAAAQRTATQTWPSASTDPPQPPSRLLVGFHISTRTSYKGPKWSVGCSNTRWLWSGPSSDATLMLRDSNTVGGDNSPPKSSAGGGGRRFVVIGNYCFCQIINNYLVSVFFNCH